MSGFMQRVITAIFFVLIVVGGLFSGPFTFVALFAIVTGLCLWEFLGMTLEMNGLKRDHFRKIIGLLLGVAPFVLLGSLKLNWINNSDDLLHTVLLFSFPLLFGLFIYELFAAAKKPFANVAYIILGIIYIGIPFMLLNLIAFKGGVFNAKIIFGMLLLTWANDTGAYLLGSRIGKTPLLPRISPKKTWEGSIGGVVVGLFVAYLLSMFFPELNLIEWLGLAIIVVIFGSIGDLIESMLKRSRNVKDSGTLLPGHGGFLDRFDAFFFLVPFASAYLLSL